MHGFVLVTMKVLNSYDILKYEYVEKRRNQPDTFVSRNNKYDFPVDQSAIYYADISVFATWNYYLLRIRELVLIGQLAQRNLC